MLDRDEFEALEIALEVHGLEAILEASDLTLLGALRLLMEDGYITLPEPDDDAD